MLVYRELTCDGRAAYGHRAPSQPGGSRHGGQDPHHIAADSTQSIIVVDPAGAVQLAQSVERPAYLMLRIDHVAPSAQRLRLGDFAAGVECRGAGLTPVASSVAPSIAMCTTPDAATLVTPRATGRGAKRAMQTAAASNPRAACTTG